MATPDTLAPGLFSHANQGVVLLPSEARERLRLLLKESAFLFSSEGQRLKNGAGGSIQWCFYGWNTLLTHEGALLAGTCLLDRLASFQSTQLAIYGYSGASLLAACIVLGSGRYTGLYIREIRKSHLSGRRIEGPADRSKSVVVIDDSISSGSTLRSAFQALEDDGFSVEGGIVLADFPQRGGVEWATGLGYRLETLFDVWKDLGAPQARGSTVYALPQLLPSDEKIEDGLDPAQVVRRVASCYLVQRTLLQPPNTLNATYEPLGGVYVSFHEEQTGRRIAYDGFFRVRYDASASVASDLIAATIKALSRVENQLSEQSLRSIRVEVRLLGALEPTSIRELDASRYGLIVTSWESETKSWVALPDSPHFQSEVGQYLQALTTAQIGRNESHQMYRCTVVKYSDPGTRRESSPSLDFAHDRQLTASMLGYIRDLLTALVKGSDLSTVSWTNAPEDTSIRGVGITIYAKDLAGCAVSWSESLMDGLVQATQNAFHDSRYTEQRKLLDPNNASISVVILEDREQLGEMSADRASKNIRLGLESIVARYGQRSAVFLPFVGPHYSWSKEVLAEELLRKAGISSKVAAWSRYRSSSWLGTSEGVFKLEYGFPVRPQVHYDLSRANRDIKLLADYIRKNLGPDQLPEYCNWPASGKSTRWGMASRILLALLALKEAGEFLGDPVISEAADRGYSCCLDSLSVTSAPMLQLPGRNGSHMADAILLVGIANCPGTGASGVSAKHSLAVEMRALLQPDGRITAYGKALGVDHDHDFMPGAVLLGLAHFLAAAGQTGASIDLTPQLTWYRRRFRLTHPWGLASWHMQAWSALYRLNGEASHRDFVFELADWALDRQLELDGSFLTDLSPEAPSFHTAFVAEGIAEAWSLALDSGDVERAQRYFSSWKAAAEFMTQLIIYPEDTYCMHNPHRSVGGVRGMPTTSEVRIDYVSHTLRALIAGARILERTATGAQEIQL